MKLTWDDDDPERTKITRRALSKKEIDEIDFKDLLMSASSEDEDENPKKDAQKLRALLLSGNEENLPEGWGGTVHDKAGDMEITFTPGLSGETKSNANENETTLERYQRKERERKKAKKAARKDRLTEKDDVPSKKAKKIDDEFFGEDSGSDQGDASDTSNPELDASKAPKSKQKKHKEKPSNRVMATEAATDAELELMMDPSSHDARKHFDMTDIIRSERRAEKGGKKHYGKRKRTEGREESNDAVDVNLEDPRFKGIYSDPRFAIDPTNPKYVFSVILSIIH